MTSYITPDQARKLLGLPPLVASWNTPGDHYREWEHPRDRFGRWIKKFGHIKFSIQGWLTDGDQTHAGVVEKINGPDSMTVRITKSPNPAEVGMRIDVKPDSVEAIKAKAFVYNPTMEVKPRPGSRPWTPFRPVLTGDTSRLGNPETWEDLRAALVGKDLIVFDTETTGLELGEHGQDNVIELSAVRMRDGEVIDTFSTLVNPMGSRIPRFVTDLTGITDTDARQGMYPDEAYDAFVEWARFDDNSVLVAHNANFDMGALDRLATPYESESKKRGVTPKGDIPDSVPVLDTLSLARVLMQKDNTPVPNNKLGTLAEYFGIDLNNAHRALEDAQAAGRLVDRLLEYGIDNNHPSAALRLDQDKWLKDMADHETAMAEWRHDMYHYLATNDDDKSWVSGIGAPKKEAPEDTSVDVSEYSKGEIADAARLFHSKASFGNFERGRLKSEVFPADVPVSPHENKFFVGLMNNGLAEKRGRRYFLTKKGKLLRAALDGQLELPKVTQRMQKLVDTLEANIEQDSKTTDEFN